MFVKGEAIVGFPFALVSTAGVAMTGQSSATGLAGYITKDGGTQTTLSNTIHEEGYGQYSVTISAAEMEADVVGLIFRNTGAVPVHFTLETTTPQQAAATETAEASASASWSTSFDGAVRDIKVLFRNITGRKNPTFQEVELIRSSVNEALQRIGTKAVGRPYRFLNKEVSKATTAGTDYIDLEADILNIHQGTVRITSEDTMLCEASLPLVKQIDVGDDFSQSVPLLYALDSADAGPNYIRMRLFPTPDAAYTVTMTTTKILGAEGIGNIPSYMTGTLLDLSTAIAMRRVGFGDPRLYQHSGEQSLKELSIIEGTDGPYYARRRYIPYYDNLQSRSEH
jgi:hypothetical protein